MRSFLPEYFGTQTYDRIRVGLDPQTRTLLEDVEPGDWMEERYMQALMQRIYSTGLRQDDDAYVKFARALAAEGISRFMKIFLSLASERFVLQKIPVVWQRLRRNAGEVTTFVEPGIVRVCYEGFPFFGDRLYHLLSLANCQALAFAAAKRFPPGRVTAHSKDSLELEFEVSGFMRR